MRPKHERGRQIRQVSEILEAKRTKLLGHVMNCDEEDLMYQVTFEREGWMNTLKREELGGPEDTGQSLQSRKP